jgi:hypothetical protein
MFCRDILELFSSLETHSLINNIKQQHVINIYYVYGNVVVELDIILNREFESIRRFSVFLAILTELGEVL